MVLDVLISLFPQLLDVSTCSVRRVTRTPEQAMAESLRSELLDQAICPRRSFY